MKTRSEKDTQKQKNPDQPPVNYFYMPAMPPTELIRDLAKWVRKKFRS